MDHPIDIFAYQLNQKMDTQNDEQNDTNYLILPLLASTPVNKNRFQKK